MRLNRYLGKATVQIGIQSGHIEKVILLFRDLIAEYPNCQWYYFFLAVALASNNVVSESIKYYLKAIKIEPDFYQAYLELCHAYDAIDQIDKLIDCCAQSSRDTTR